MDKKLNLANILKDENPNQLDVLVGFDGFIDEIVHVVDKRQDPVNYTRVKTIKDFSEKVGRASGLSTNIEFVPIKTKIGGNGPIMANALNKHNPNMTYIGTLGKDDVHPVFKKLADRAKVYTLEKPGETQAVEFNDGKLMIGKMNSLVNVDYNQLISIVSEDELVELLDQVDLFASVNWSMLPYMTDIWHNIISRILPKLKERETLPLLFVDIADPEKRENKEIIDALMLLKKFKSHFRVALGLNKKEAYDVASILDLFDDKDISSKTLKEVNKALYKVLDIDYVVVHPVDRSSVVFEGEYYEEQGPYISEPKLTTGAGDNFNAGFVLGLLLGLKPDQALLTGMSTSGYYVRNADSPTFHQLINFIEDWANDKI